MITFGKKCPFCGEKDFITRSLPRKKKSRTIAEAYFCTGCRRHLLHFFFFSLANESRRYTRKQLPPFFLVRIPGETMQYGRIKNISEGGICFSRLDSSAILPEGQLTIDIYNCNDGSSLERLPTQIVASSNETVDHSIASRTVSEISGRFVNLNQAQKKVLHTCIEEYGAI